MDEFDKKLYSLGKRGYPKSAFYEITYRCNANCDFCFLPHHNAAGELDTINSKHVLDKLADNGVMNLLITGGEPFVRSDLIDILLHAVQKDFYHIRINTNGIELNNDHIAFLKEHRLWVKEVKMPLFSFDPEVHDMHLGVAGAYRAMMRNAQRLRTQGIMVRFSFVALDTNVNQLSSAITRCQENGFVITHSPFKFKGVHMSEKLWRRSTDIDFMRTYIAQLPLQAKNNLRTQMRDALENKAKEQMCPGLSTGVGIRPTGDISPCLSFLNLNIGNIVRDYTTTLREILLSSKEYLALQKLSKNDFSPCRSCEYKAFCIICPGRIHSQTGRMEKAEPQACNYALAVRELLDE